MLSTYYKRNALRVIKREMSTYGDQSVKQSNVIPSTDVQVVLTEQKVHGMPICCSVDQGASHCESGWTPTPCSRL